MDAERYTGPYPESTSFEVDNIAIREPMPPGLVERPGGGPLASQWLLVWFHAPAFVGPATDELRVAADDCQLWAPGQLHRLGHPLRPWAHSWLFVRGRRFAHAVRTCGVPVGRPFALGDPGAAHDCLRACLEELLRPDTEAEIVFHHLAAWLHRLARAGRGGERAGDRGIARARRLIEEQPEREWSLTELAAAAELSPSHFSARFRAAYGRAPIAALIELRLRRAQDLLLTTREAVATIAARVGFGDARHFARSFHRRFGCAPRELRRDRAG